MRIAFVLNGQKREMDLTGEERLVDVLRHDLGLAGIREGCDGYGGCGGCTILVDGESRLACLMKTAQIEGRHLVTIEGIEKDGRFAPLLEAFASSGAVQCGYCTPAMVLAAVDLLRRNGDPDEEQVLEALSGNLCRCTGYRSIAQAVVAGAKKMREAGTCLS